MNTRKLLITLAALLLPFAGHAQIISALPAASSVAGTDIYPTSQGATTRKATAAQLYTYIETSLLAANLTWTGVHTQSAAEPRRIIVETDQGADLKNWDWDLQAGVYCLRTRTDADGAGVSVACFTRGTTTTLSNVSIGAGANTYTFGGTGTATFSGSVVASSTGSVQGGRLQVNGTTVPAFPGFYRPGTDRLGFATATTYRGEFDANGQFIIATVGRGISIPEGSNAKMGTCTLVAGACTVSTTAVTANSRILYSVQLGGGTQGWLNISAKTAGTSFVITSTSALETSVVAWMLVEPS